MRAFFGRGEFCVFHCMLCHFVSGSYWKHHVSQPVMTVSNISALRKRSDEMWSWRCFWSCVKIRGTIFVEIFLIPKSSFTICRTIPYSYSVLLLLLSHLIFNLSAPRFVLCPHLHLFLHFWLPTCCVVLHIFSPFLEPPVPFRNTQFLHIVFTISHC